MKENLSNKNELKLFELSMAYVYRKNNLPEEKPMLLIGVTGNEFYSLKGIAESIFASFGIPFPKDEGPISHWFTLDRSLSLGQYGIVGEINPELLTRLSIPKSVTMLELDLAKLVTHRREAHTYTPIPKYPASFEDIALVIPDKTLIGPMIRDMESIDPLVTEVTLLDRYQNIRTFHVVYQSTKKNLTAEDVQPVWEKILRLLSEKYQAVLKTI